jgi:hypothetical protein
MYVIASLQAPHRKIASQTFQWSFVGQHTQVSRAKYRRSAYVYF